MVYGSMEYTWALSSSYVLTLGPMYVLCWVWLFEKGFEVSSGAAEWYSIVSIKAVFLHSRMYLYQGLYGLY